ncbi:hypothetical protein LEP1GSC008_1889 [Leptospira kirschneri serovar Bulgarica str. Nikolaevo]|uniref:Uncharacterized protein n=1 Tax=Leptospira kirschneri serovar Bulgarica str. Nikolaevo TaxID=1240687 RepID=M6F3E8_9LEPT|nr:hypothetical protein LEP1GSC008_1889 [Leptospira kirschneri serovar Bulgarica str. Nikolaevo]
MYIWIFSKTLMYKNLSEQEQNPKSWNKTEDRSDRLTIILM